jgi:hypothetical protein
MLVRRLAYVHMIVDVNVGDDGAVRLWLDDGRPYAGQWPHRGGTLGAISALGVLQREYAAALDHGGPNEAAISDTEHLALVFRI